VTNHRRILAFVCAVTCLLAARGLRAQSTGTTTADLKGRIVDDKALPLPGVTVTAVNRDTGQARTTVSRADGDAEVQRQPRDAVRVTPEPDDGEYVDEDGDASFDGDEEA